MATTGYGITEQHYLRANEKWLGWHFLHRNGHLQFAPYTKVVEGQMLSAIEKPLKLCEYGLHASLRAVDALKYAPGPILCKVRLSGWILVGTDKACATNRTCLKMADAENVLHEFGCWCAEQVLLAEQRSGWEPDQRSWDAITARRKWIKGEISGKELLAAAHAANEATVLHMAYGTYARAYNAAYVAARSARSGYGAAAAARFASDAYSNTLGFATTSKQNEKLEELLNELLNKEETSNV